MKLAFVTCLECGCPSAIDEWNPHCPNPACYVGFAKHAEEMQEWKAAQEAYMVRVMDASQNRGTSFNPNAFRDRFNSRNPVPEAPKERVKNTVYKPWEA